jgi:hypothetical protein
MRTLSREYLKKEARSSGACIRVKRTYVRSMSSESNGRQEL